MTGQMEASTWALTALVGALIWLVKAMTTRSDSLIAQRDKEASEAGKRLDKLTEKRDEEMRRAFRALEKAISSFSVFEAQEIEVHDKIIERLDAMHAIQTKVMLQLETAQKIQVEMLEQLKALRAA